MPQHVDLDGLCRDGASGSIGHGHSEQGFAQQLNGAIRLAPPGSIALAAGVGQWRLRQAGQGDRRVKPAQFHSANFDGLRKISQPQSNVSPDASETWL